MAAAGGVQLINTSAEDRAMHGDRDVRSSGMTMRAYWQRTELAVDSSIAKIYK
jgi:hypothetical protein